MLFVTRSKMAGRAGLLFLVAAICFSSICSCAEENQVATVKEGHTRHKRWVGTAVQVFSLATGVTTVTLNMADYYTDGAVYYPSINAAKAVVSFYCISLGCL